MALARIGVVGAGWWACEFHIPHLLKNSHADLVAVSRLGKEELDKIQQRFEIQVASENHLELYAYDLDGVIVASPHVLHEEHASAAIENGCHVLVEKPAARKAEELEPLVQLKRQHEVKVRVGFNHRYHRSLRKAKELFYTGDNISGTEAAELGMANKAVPFDQLEEQTLALAERVANLPADHLAQLKIHMNRFHENMGIYSSVHSSTDLDAAGTFTTQSYGWSDKFKEGGLKEALAWRDGPYQDYSATPRN